MLDKWSPRTHRSYEDVLRTVSDALVERRGVANPEVLGPDTSLTSLGIDSLTLIDVTVALEHALGSAEFPMQQWLDREAGKSGPSFTIGAIAEECLAQIENRRH